jgi:hypothetical protein
MNRECVYTIQHLALGISSKVCDLPDRKRVWKIDRPVTLSTPCRSNEAFTSRIIGEQQGSPFVPVYRQLLGALLISVRVSHPLYLKAWGSKEAGSFDLAETSQPANGSAAVNC